MTSSHWPDGAPGARRSGSSGLDLRLLSALLGLLFIATPVANAVSPAVGDLVAGGAMLLSLVPIAMRVRWVPRISLTMTAWVAAYAIGCLFTPLADQGVRHWLTTASAAAAGLLFATYGKEMTEFRWFRWSACILIAAGIVGVNFSELPKNLMGGTIIYLAALLVSLLIVSRPRSLWFYSLVFVGTSATMAIALDFRSLIGYTLVVLIGYWGASRLPHRTFWLAGLIGATGAVVGITWYFLNALSHPTAVRFTTWVAEISGRRATSGRDVLWSAIVRRLEDDRLFGLGVGVLPRDVLVTSLSAHSTYMQTYLQLGILGIVLLCCVLLAFWKPLAFSDTSSGTFGAAVFLMFVVHNAMEVIMFQNALVAAVPAWCAIGLAVSLSGQTRAPAAGHSPN